MNRSSRRENAASAERGSTLPLQAGPPTNQEAEALHRLCVKLLSQLAAQYAFYLRVLNLQLKKIEARDPAALEQYVKIEERTVSRIGSLEKALSRTIPLRRTLPACDTVGKEEFEQLSSEHERLKEAVLCANSRNRERLKIHMAELQKTLKGLSNPYSGRMSVFSRSSEAGCIISSDA